MAKLKETIGNAVLEVEGDEAAITSAVRFFHLVLAEQSLRAIEEELSHTPVKHKERRRYLRKRRQEVEAFVSELKSSMGTVQ